MVGVLIKKGNLDMVTHTGECLVKRKAEMWMMLLQAKNHPRLPATTCSLGRGMEQILFHGPQKKQALSTSSSHTSRLHNCEKIIFCCLSPPVGGPPLWQPWQTNTVCDVFSLFSDGLFPRWFCFCCKSFPGHQFSYSISSSIIASSIELNSSWVTFV